ncbi:MAG: hypothetical protein K2Q27_16135 [Novosphingobium sp.]|jgi:hypothetical protein|uniref:LamG domain-containing protein n=1 Tax=Novosphingobium sp. NDB2Meth1 TaxID=1892847 RepID=UPI000ADBA3C6|nr:LamG domain-containing protein [Novosphingobium sp. NDB2Meth1]MBY0394781.1 hypothetical protein [Novosphingobium sp.]
MALIQTLKGVTAPAGALFYGQSWPNIGGNSLYAAYMFGNGQKNADSAHHDYSFHGRKRTQTGAPTLGAGFATPDANNYYTTPFTDTELVAAGTPNEWTFCGVAKANGTDGTLFSAEHISDLAGFRAWLSSSGTFSPHMYDADGPTGSANPQITGALNLWEFYAVSFSATQVKSYRRNSASAMLTATATPSPASVATSSKQFLLGRRTPNTSAAGGISICTEAFYNRVMTAGEIDTIYATIKAFLAAQGYAFAI